MCLGKCQRRHLNTRVSSKRVIFGTDWTLPLTEPLWWICRDGDSDFVLYSTKKKKKVVPVISEEDSFQDGSLRALWVSVRLTFVPPKKANLTFKRSHYLTSSQPRPAAAFPLDVCSLFEICLILPLLMSAALCHPLELREWPEKWWQPSSRFHLQWWWDHRHPLFITAHSAWHSDDTVGCCSDSEENCLFIKVTALLEEVPSFVFYIFSHTALKS